METNLIGQSVAWQEKGKEEKIGTIVAVSCNDDGIWRFLVQIATTFMQTPTYYSFKNVLATDCQLC